MNIFKFILPILSAFLGSNLYFRRNATNLFATMLQPFSSYVIDEGGGSESEQQLLEKIKDSVEKQLSEKMQEYAKGKITQDQFEKSLTELKSDISKFDDLQAKYDTMTDILQKQGETIKKLNEQTQKAENTFKTKAEMARELISKFICSKTFDDFTKRGLSGQTKSIKLNDAILDEKVVDMTNDYSGTVMITEQSGSVIDVPNREVNIRDLIPVVQTDQPNIAGQEVYSWSDEFTGSVTELAENESAPEGSFKVKENTWGVKRIAAFVDISKRNLKTNGLRWLMGHLNNALPKKLKFVEDWQLLFGDDTNDRVKGMTIDATTIDLSGGSYIAGAMTLAATFNSGTQTIVTFAAAHGMRNGDTLTIAASANYNATYTGVIVISATQIIIDATYVAEATGAWTGDYVNPFYQNIDEAQEYDALRVSIAVMSYKDRMINGGIINPIDGAKIDLLKGTDARYIGITRDTQGILRIMGVPIIETTAMPAGKFVVAAFGSETMELAEFTPLTLSVKDDVTYAKANKVAFILEEEIIFPIYNKLAVAYGNFATIITQIETP